MRRMLLGLMMVMGMSGTTMGGWAYEYSGSATGLQADVTLLALPVAQAGPLPAWGGADSTTVASAGISIPLVLGSYDLVETGVLSSSTDGGNAVVGQTGSHSSVANISLLDGLVQVTAVSSTAIAQFNTTTGIGSFSGDSVITGLTIGGNAVTLTGPNQTVSIELLGVTIASLTINEQISSISPDGQNVSMTVNALHLQVLGIPGVLSVADVIIGQSKAGVIQHVPEPSSFAMVLGAFAVGGGWKFARRKKADSTDAEATV
ncbi:choice-of-anchor P family protein [Schlesneria sp. DSM 10557]|uniref:choice-of-anchor P family protein n=1 Tax=Schlesneria sp. DSM 10557 TaxID=3044399 RepID=UPI0035A06045